MKHVTLTGLRLRALVVTVVLAAAALGITSPAMAVTEPSAPYAGTITKNPPTADRWNGQILGAADANDCGTLGEVPNPAADGLFVCSEHLLDPADSGRVEVVVDVANLGVTDPQVAVAVFECLDPNELPPLVQVVNPACGPRVAFGLNNVDPLAVRVTFTAKGTADEPADATIVYSVRVIPILTEIVDYAACAAYIDTGVDLCPNNPALDVINNPQPEPVPADAFLACTPNGATGDRRFVGVGQIDAADGKKAEQVTVSLRQRAEKRNSPQGQINHRTFATKRHFHSKRIACATFVDGGKTVEARGIGWTKVDGMKPVKVCFIFRGQDAGEKGQGDNYSLQTVPFFRGADGKSGTSDDRCGATGVEAQSSGGPITKGDFRYRGERGDDAEYAEYDRDNTYANDADYDWSHERQ